MEESNTPAPTNTGSSTYQVEQLSRRISSLSEHLKNNKKDKHSRRGLLGLLSKRRKHLAYLQRKKPAEYEVVAAKMSSK